uniref:Zinc finger protein 513 n=1 Tax=Sinocyclocheilus rhinocerous TaxID=307959 RepID=A0A673K663_9TELE
MLVYYVTFSHFLLGEQTRHFDDPNLLYYSVTADMGMPVYGFSDEDCSSYNRLGMESDFEDPRDTESEREEMGPDAAFAPYLSCRQCGQLLGDPLSGALDLAGLYCLQCGAEGGDSDRQDRPLEEAHPTDATQGKVNRVRSTSDGSSCKTYSCKLCSFSSRYSNHLKRHMKTHNGEKPYRCQQCAYASAQLVNLQRHVRTHTGEKPYKCEICTFACNSLGNLKRHQRMHTYFNDQCSTGMQIQRMHKEALVLFKTASFLLLRISFYFILCTLSTSCCKPKEEAKRESVVSDLTLHISSDPDFLQSYDTLRTESDPLPELLFPFTCRVCGAVLEDEEGATAQICSKCTLERDMLSKSSPSSPEKGDKLYSCTSCPFVTQYPNHLARHTKTHSGEKPYKCPQCNYASAHFDNLKRHHRVHTGEKPYKCRVCDYACGNLANLKRHERIHSGAKPFQCSVCSYSCNQSMNLKRHMLRHTGEKPFKCQECGYTTGHWDNYKRHQKKHGHSAEGWLKMHLPEKEEEDEEGEM